MIAPEIMQALRAREEWLARRAVEKEAAMRNHPGHVVLRTLIPDADARRRFVADACRQDGWNAALLVRSVGASHSRATTGRSTVLVNVSPEDARLVRDFIESI